jgi:hypothetical protein
MEKKTADNILTAAASTATQAASDAKTLGGPLSAATLLGSSIAPAGTFTMPATPILTDDDFSIINSGGLNIGLFGGNVPLAVHQNPHWLQLLRTESLPSKLFLAMRSGRGSVDYKGVEELAVKVINQGGIDSTSIGLAWLNATYGSGVPGVVVNRSTALRTTSNRSNLLGSVPTNLGAAKALADYWVFVFVFFFVEEYHVGGVDGEDIDHVVIDGLRSLLPLLGFDLVLAKSSKQTSTGLRLGDFSMHQSEPVGTSDEAWQKPPELTARGSGQHIANGMIAGALCMAGVLGISVNDVVTDGAVGGIELAELSVIARSLTYDSHLLTFGMSTLTHVTKLLNNCVKAIRFAVAYVVQPIVVAASPRQLYRNFIAQVMSQMVPQNVYELLLQGRLSAVTGPRQMFAVINRMNTANTSEKADPRNVREVYNKDNVLVGAIFDEREIMFADFGVSYIMFTTYLDELLKDVAHLLGGEVEDVLVSLLEGRITAISNDSDNFVTCAVDHDGTCWCFDRMSGAAKRTVETWLPSATSAANLTFALTKLRATIAVGLEFFGGGAIGRGTDTGNAVLFSKPGAAGTAFSQFQSPWTVNGVEILYLPAGAKDGSSTARHIHPRYLCTPLSTAILLLRVLIDTQRVLTPTLSSELLLNANGQPLSSKDLPIRIMATLKTIVGEALPPELRVLDWKHFDGVASVWFAQIDATSRHNRAVDATADAIVADISAGQGHAVSTHLNTYAPRTYVDGSQGSDSELRRQSTAASQRAFCRWRCGSAINPPTQLFDSNAVQIPPSARGSAALVDFARRVFGPDDNNDNDDDSTHVRSLLHVMSSRIACRYLNVDLPAAAMRPEQIDAVVHIIVHSSKGESGVLVKPMSSGKTLDGLAVPLLFSELLRLSTVDIQRLFPDRLGVDDALIALRALPVQSVLVCCAYKPLTTQYVEIARNAGLVVQILNADATIKDTSEIVAITPEVLVKPNTVLNMHRIHHRVPYLIIEEVTAALQTKHWRIRFAQFKNALKRIQLPRILVSGTVPPAIVQDLAELVGLDVNTRLFEYRLPVLSGDDEPLNDLWSGLQVGLLRFQRLPQHSLINRVTNNVVDIMHSVNAKQEWDSNASASLIIVHTVRDAHRLALQLRSCDDVDAHSVHRPKPEHEIEISGCAAPECAMSSSGDLRSVLNELLDKNTGVSRTHALYFIVATGALVGVSDTRIQAVFSTALYSVVDLFQGLLRSHRVANRPSWSFMVSLGDHMSLSGTQPTRPSVAAYSGTAADILVSPWGGELVMNMLAEAVSDLMIDAFILEDDIAAVVDALDDTNIEHVTPLFYTLHQLMFEQEVHSSLQQYTDHFGGTPAGLINLLQMPCNYDESSNSAAFNGDETEHLADLLAVGLTSTVEDNRVVQSICMLSVLGLCLHCGLKCKPLATTPGYICASVLSTGCKRCLEDGADHTAEQCSVVDLRPLVEGDGDHWCYECFSPMCEKLSGRVGTNGAYTGVAHPCLGAATYSVLMCVFKYRSTWLQNRYGVQFDSRSQYLSWIQRMSNSSSLFNFHHVVADYFEYFISEFSNQPLQTTLQGILLRPPASILPNASFVQNAIDEMRALSTSSPMNTDVVT